MSLEAVVVMKDKDIVRIQNLFCLIEVHCMFYTENVAASLVSDFSLVQQGPIQHSAVVCFGLGAIGHKFTSSHCFVFSTVKYSTVQFWISQLRAMNTIGYGGLNQRVELERGRKGE